MGRLTKRQKIVNTSVVSNVYTVLEAIDLFKSLPLLKFNESIDVSVILGIDTNKSDQTVRGVVVLPHGTGRKVRVAVFAQGDYAKIAQDSGADIVGFENLEASIKKGNIDFDILITTPDAMRTIGQLGQILGPRGLMPNPKMGTITTDIELAIKNAKGGQISYRADKGGVVNSSIGKINFSNVALKENLFALLIELKRVKPSSSKGVYLRKIVLSSTMGPGLIIDQTSLT